MTLACALVEDGAAEARPRSDKVLVTRVGSVELASAPKERRHWRPPGDSERCYARSPTRLHCPRNCTLDGGRASSDAYPWHAAVVFPFNFAFLHLVPEFPTHQMRNGMQSLYAGSAPALNCGVLETQLAQVSAVQSLSAAAEAGLRLGISMTIDSSAPSPLPWLKTGMVRRIGVCTMPPTSDT